MESHVITQIIAIVAIFFFMFLAFKLMNKVKNRPTDEEISDVRHTIASMTDEERKELEEEWEKSISEKGTETQEKK